MSAYSAVVVMGVSGVGKTHVGRLVARELGWEFHDGDDYHSPENVEKMRAGVPLTDADRAPWLERLHELLAGTPRVVLACSALKQGYREVLLAGIAERVLLVYLRAPMELISARLARRRGHYMPASLLQSQFAALEEPGPGEAVWVDAQLHVDEAVGLIVKELGRS